MPRAVIESFIILQSLTGIGHLARCSSIANALSSISNVTMFSGGRSVEGYSAPSSVDFIQLPATRWDLTAASPMPVDPRYTMAEVEHMSSDLLVESYLQKRPRLVIIDQFPFAPKRFGKTTLNKLFNTINEKRARPITICSMRTYPRWRDDDADVIWINEHLRKNFSYVFHHADATLFPLSSLGPYIQSALSGIPVWQTGFVRRPLNQMQRGRRSAGLLLTVGGGSPLGAILLRNWIRAARAGSSELFPINAVCGPWMDAESREVVYAERATNVFVHDWIANMDELIGAARAVVCMGGYNTLVEALSLKKPVLAFPDKQLGDQAFQVNALHSKGMLLQGSRLQSQNELTAMMNELPNFRPQHPIDYRGAERSVEILSQMLGVSCSTSSTVDR